MDKVVIEVTRKDVEDFLSSQHYKPTPEVVEAILQALKIAYEVDGVIGNLIDSVMFTSDELVGKLESE